MDNESKIMILHDDGSAQTYYVNPTAETSQIQSLLNAHKKLTRKSIYAMFIQAYNSTPVEVTSLYDIRLSNV